MRVLVTGTAGFIGSHVALRLLDRGDEVVGLDNLSDYYDVNLKKARLARFGGHANYTHVHADLADRAAMEALYRPVVSVETGVANFVKWYQGHFRH